MPRDIIKLKRSISDHMEKKYALANSSYKQHKKVDKEGVALFEKLCDQVMTQVVMLSTNQSNYSSSGILV